MTVYNLAQWSTSGQKKVFPHTRVGSYSFINPYTDEERIIVECVGDPRPYSIYSLTTKSFIYTDENPNVSVCFSNLSYTIRYLELWRVTP